MLNGMTYNELAAECHSNNMKWWHDLTTGERLNRNMGELLMLVVSEFAEALEGSRKNLMDDKLPHRKMQEVELVDGIIRIGDFAGGFGIDIDAAAERMGDIHPEYVDIFPSNDGEGLLLMVKAIINAHDAFAEGDGDDGADLLYAALRNIALYAAIRNYDLDGAYTEKTAFNKVRKDHTAEARLAADGKKF